MIEQGMNEIAWLPGHARHERWRGCGTVFEGFAEVVVIFGGSGPWGHGWLPQGRKLQVKKLAGGEACR